ncbi:MAG: ABC transporter ATP-binding protein [Clostridia bacterium]|nr:ABC transporter ATP-binding protein [Clostridia bacterium]
MMMGPPPGEASEKNRVPKPQNIREVPSFVFNVVKNFFSRLFYIFGLVWQTRPWILFALLFIAIIQGFLPVIKSLVAADIINELSVIFLNNQNGEPVSFDATMQLLIIQFALIFLTSIISNVEMMVTRVSGELVVNHVNTKIMKKAKTIDIASFDRPEFYEKLENASREAGSRPIQILRSTFSIMSTLISMVSYIAILWAISPGAPWLIIALSLPSAIITFSYRKKNFSYMRRNSKSRRELSYYSGLTTNKDMAKELRIFGLYDHFTEKYTNVFKKYFKGLKSLFIKEGVLNIAVSVVSAVVNCVLFLYIANGVFNGEILVGDYSLYTGALNSVSHGITTFIATMSSIYEGTLFIDNLITFMDEKQTVTPLLSEECTEPRKVKHHTGHRIELQNVSFRYPGTERFVIKDFSAVLEPGDTVVLVGLNGAGKTTLIKLITRLYDPTEGRILLDGHDIREYDLKELYSLYGIIFQDFGKYAVSVKDNITFSRIDDPVDEQAILDAAEKSSSTQFIAKLPNEYNTALTRVFEKDGIELSIGQWQKLSIARAFYSDSDILILDEPTASLDAIAEQEIYNQFDTLRKDKTTIFVSHRLSSATVANKILVIDGGVLTEQGNHHELMAKRGTYYELFSTQAKRYMENPEDGDGAQGGEGHPHGEPPHGRPPRGEQRPFRPEPPRF